MRKVSASCYEAQQDRFGESKVSAFQFKSALILNSKFRNAEIDLGLDRKSLYWELWIFQVALSNLK